MKKATAAVGNAMANIMGTSGAKHRGQTQKSRLAAACLLAIFGAGEGIRTLDPNLGKVVLYP